MVDYKKEYVDIIDALKDVVKSHYEFIPIGIIKHILEDSKYVMDCDKNE